STKETRIGGLQDHECIPCKKWTPTSEIQYAFQLSLVKEDVLSASSRGHTSCTGEQSTGGIYPGLPGALLPLLQVALQQTLPACGFLLLVAGDSLKFVADEDVEEESLFPIPPGQETSPESPLSESIFETQLFNPILDDN
ncbi:hypothetical protein MC885_007110, partial [Smutsia gigantea]